MVQINKYGGWSCKDLQNILGFQHETKVSQAMEPWLDKAAKLYLENPTNFLAMVIYASVERAPISDSELNQRCDMLNGRANRVGCPTSVHS